jgi:hypothetical protein
MSIYKDSEDKEFGIVRAIVGLCAILFTYFGFFHKPEGAGDFDRIMLWDRLHPFTFGDWVGVPLFYAFCLVLMGIPQKLLGKLYNPAGSSQWNLIGFAVGVLSIVLIWNL